MRDGLRLAVDLALLFDERAIEPGARTDSALIAWFNPRTCASASGALALGSRRGTSAWFPTSGEGRVRFCGSLDLALQFGMNGRQIGDFVTQALDLGELQLDLLALGSNGIEIETEFFLQRGQSAPRSSAVSPFADRAAGVIVRRDERKALTEFASLDLDIVEAGRDRPILPGPNRDRRKAC
ncbi:MAG: hypothetical protein R3C97_18205 [Geminicoccaceae bacterium]